MIKTIIKTCRLWQEHRCICRSSWIVCFCSGHGVSATNLTLFCWTMRGKTPCTFSSLKMNNTRTGRGGVCDRNDQIPNAVNITVISLWTLYRDLSCFTRSVMRLFPFIPLMVLSALASFHLCMDSYVEKKEALRPWDSSWSRCPHLYSQVKFNRIFTFFSKTFFAHYC